MNSDGNIDLTFTSQFPHLDMVLKIKRPHPKRGSFLKEAIPLFFFRRSSLVNDLNSAPPAVLGWRAMDFAGGWQRGRDCFGDVWQTQNRRPILGPFLFLVVFSFVWMNDMNQRDLRIQNHVYHYIMFCFCFWSRSLGKKRLMIKVCQDISSI